MNNGLSKRPEGYDRFLVSLKERIRSSQLQAAQAVNTSLVTLYWGIGKEILERQQELGWGAKVVNQLASDLKKEFPNVKGFSSRNLNYMRRLAEIWPNEEIVQQLLHNLPWFHLCVITDKVKSRIEQEWYIKTCVQYGWSRSILAAQIDTNLYDREGKAITNFEDTLPATQSDLSLIHI